jgi:manganese/zinc/iron transport system permease protein
MFTFLQIFLAPWSPDELAIFWPILVQGALVSVTLALIGCFLVVRGMSLLGDALSHAVLPGIVIGFLIGNSLSSPWILIGASAMGLAAAALVQAVQEHSRVKEDASLGIVFTTLFAAGVVMINQFASGTDLDPGCVLYGNIEYLIRDEPWPKIVPMMVIAGLVIVGLLVFYRRLLLCTFDPGLAISVGVSAAATHYAMMATLSVAVVASFESVGAILAVALLVMPGATARLWSDRMPIMLLLAAGHAILSTVAGYWISNSFGPLRAFEGTSTAGAICSAGFAIFLGSWLFGPRGIVHAARARVTLRRTIAVENVLKTIDELGARAGVAGAVPVPASSVVRELHVGRRAFDRALRRGIDSGWVRGDADNLFLTTTGAERSSRLRRAHDLWEQYLRDQVGLAADHVHDAADWIEHHLHDEEIATIDETLSPRKE